VLIIEDIADSRSMLATLLSLEGFTVFTAADGLTGLELIEKEKPDVAIVDIGLPGMDGYEVARRVRAKLPRGTIRLLALTGYGQVEDRERALQAGFDDHLVKPIDPTHLTRVLAAGK
jgi:two-component system CheB/CheR fusion protein